MAGKWAKAGKAVGSVGLIRSLMAGLPGMEEVVREDVGEAPAVAEEEEATPVVV